MKPPVEHVRVTAKGKEILIKIKRRTGLDHWNEICRVALCRSLANPISPPKIGKPGESSIDIEWKIFAGPYQKELAAMVTLAGKQHGINVDDRDELAQYFRAHIERGIATLQNCKDLSSLFQCGVHLERTDKP